MMTLPRLSDPLFSLHKVTQEVGALKNHTVTESELVFFFCITIEVKLNFLSLGLRHCSNKHTFHLSHLRSQMESQVF